MIIDTHMHLWDRVDGNVGEAVTAGVNGMVSIGDTEVLGMPPWLTDGRNPCEVFMAVMDAAGVDAAVVTQEYLDGAQNEYLAGVRKKHPGRFFVHGLLEFRRPAGLEEEFQHIEEFGDFRGIKLPASYLAAEEPRIFLIDQRLMAVFERMEYRRMVLSVDLDYGDSQVGELREVARSFPGMIIALGHFGMVNRPGWREQLMLAREPNIYMESGGITWLFRNEGPPFPGAQEAFREAVDTVGADKLMWGSDYPRTMVDFTYEQTLDFLRDGCSFLGDGDRAAILGETARRLYGFEEPAKPLARMKKITELD